MTNTSDTAKLGKSGRTIIGDIDFHGYPVGDRLLEDVYFIVDIETDADGKLHAGEAVILFHTHSATVTNSTSLPLTLKCWVMPCFSSPALMPPLMRVR